MFEGAGLAVHNYPYYDAATGGLAFAAMCATLQSLPAKSIVLLHACCHNPTGVDLTRAQWDALVPILAERELVPYLDLAYQGFGDGIVEDAYALRALAAARGRDGRPLAFFVANSFSKSMSLYGERCGALSVVCADAGEATQRPRPAQVHGPPQLFEPADPRWADRRRGAERSRPAPHLGRRAGGDARAHQGDAPGPARRSGGQGAGARLRLLPEPARHVQLHRPRAAAGRPPARGIRGLPGPLGADVRGRPEPRQRRADRARRWRRCSPAEPPGARTRALQRRRRPAKRRCAKRARPVATLAKRSPRTRRAPANARCSRWLRMSSPVEPPVR